MAAYPINKERKNFSRLCQAVVDLCTDILRDILVRKIQPVNLKKELAKCTETQSTGFKPQDRVLINNVLKIGSYRGFDITLLYQILRTLYTQDLRNALIANVDPVQIDAAVKNCPALSSEQGTKLTSDEMVAVKHSETTNSYAHFKDGLLQKLHEHLCPSSSVMIHPTKPWGATPDQGAITLGDDIERIRIMRNKVYGHITTTEVSDTDFNKYWKSLEEIMERLDNHLSSQYKEALDKIRVSSLDLKAEEKYFDQIRKLSEGISNIERNVCDVERKLNTVISGIQSEATGIKGKIETFQDKQEKMTDDVQDLTVLANTLKEKQEKVTYDVTGLKTTIDAFKDKHDEMQNNVAGLKDNIGKVADKVELGITNTTTKHEELEKVTAILQTDVRQLESVVKDPVPEHLRRRFHMKMAEWEGEDSVFIETRACASVRNSITDNTLVTVAGNGGSGKSAIIHHLALEFKREGFDILPVKDPTDIEKYLQIDQKQLFVIDDPLGVHSMNRDKFIKWLDFNIEPSASINMKVLCSIRRLIVNEPDFKSKNNILNKTVVDIQDDKNSLTLTEKISMIRQHIKVKKIDLVITEEAKKMFETQEELFPLACKLYVSSEEFYKANDWTFFQSPFKLVLEDLQTMKLHDKVKYCVLILCLASENHLDPEVYRPERSEEIEKVKSFILACELTCEALIAEFQNAFESLLSVYLKWENGILSFSHDLIYDVVAYHFGQKYQSLVISSLSSKFISRRVIVGNEEADDPYVIRLDAQNMKDLVQRMLIDVEKREFKYVFTNKCWSNDDCFDTFKGIFDKKIGNRITQSWNRFWNSKTTLDIFTKHQNDSTCEMDNIHESNAASTWTWYYVAMKVLNSCAQSITALHWIAAFGHRKMFTYLWRKLSLYKKNKIVESVPLLHFACLGGEIEILKMVLEIEIDKINVPFSSTIDLYPIHLAAYKNENIIQCLISVGVDTNIKESNTGRTAIFYAAGCNNTSACSMLIHSDRGLKCEDPECKIEPIQDSKFNINLTDCIGCTALYIAAQNNSIGVAKILLDHNAESNQCRRDGTSPLFIASENNNTEVLKVLLDHQADVNLCSYNEFSPLYMASQQCNDEIVKMLLDHGAIPNYRRKDGTTSLYIAAQNNGIDVVKLLLERKADVNLCRNDGTSPLFIATQKNNREVTKLLLDYRADCNLCIIGGVSPLYIAAWQNNLDIAKLLLDHKANPNFRRKDGSTPLYIAAQHDSKGVAKLLLKWLADPNVCRIDGTSPLYIAAQLNNVIIAKLLLDNKADTKLCRFGGESPLHIVSQKNYTVLTKLLLDYDADPNICKKNGVSPLHIAAQKNHIDVAKLLLDHQANPNLCTSDGSSPLYVAVEMNNTAVVKLLLQYNADTNLYMKNGCSPVFLASENNNTSILKLLLEHNANPNLCRNDGSSPLFIAVQNNNVDAVELLLAGNADPNLCRDVGTSPLYVAAKNNFFIIAEKLLKKHADPSSGRTDGASPLHIAVEEKRIDMVKLLLDQNIDPNLCDRTGASPLYIAAANNDIDVVKLLLDANANPNLCSKRGTSPLFIAVQANSINVAKLLLDYNADPNLCRKDGCSPLFVATENNNSDIVQLLLEHGADPNLSRYDGYSPLYMAAEKNFAEVARLILNCKVDPTICVYQGASPFDVAKFMASADVMNIFTKNAEQQNTCLK